MSSNDELCPICGAGRVASRVGETEAEYKGQMAMVPTHYLECEACGSDFAGNVETRANKRAVLAFRKRVDGLLTGAEIQALRARYKLSQKQAARLFGGGPVAFSKYENDDVAHSEAMDKLLRLVQRSELAFWELVDQEGMTAELVVSKHATTSIITNKLTSNVIVGNFGNEFRVSAARGMHAYHLESNAEAGAAGEKKWK